MISSGRFCRVAVGAALLLVAAGRAGAGPAAAYQPTAAEVAFPEAEPMAPGRFQPTWESLQQYTVPEWFRDAKFGFWAHWGPQSQPEMGDWYARTMYQPVSRSEWARKTYPFHLARYGHPSVFGFKDVIRTWRAENWDPEKLMALYRRAGAQYFMALGNHHDNFDLWDSKYQPWNATKVGPGRDIIGGWAAAARKAGLRFGVSLHAARAWNWYGSAQGADPDGPLAGVPYDGRLTAAQGRGQWWWWQHLDPQDLYAQNHPVNDVSSGWQIAGDAGPDDPRHPSRAYLNKFYNRTVDLINRYHPDLLYFDDDVLPFDPFSDIGRRIVAHFYNSNLARYGGSLEAVVTGKHLNAQQKHALVYDIERGRSPEILPLPWQTDTCIGGWFYDRSLYEQDGYRSAAEVVQLLADIVSKNGNLMLAIPLRGDGTPDPTELRILDEIGAWMDVNRDALIATRPWKVYGEGPSTVAPAEANSMGGIKDTGHFTAEDIRFTQTKDGQTVYAILLGWPPGGQVTIRALGAGSALYPGEIGAVRLLGGNAALEFARDGAGLHLRLPATPPAAWAATACVLQVDRVR